MGVCRSQPGVILHYLRLSVWPYPQCLDYGWPIETRWLVGIALPGLAVLGLLAASVVAMLRGRRIGFLGIAFFLILAPTSSFMPIQDLCFEHRMYLPLACVVTACVLAGHAIFQRLPWPSARTCSVAVLLARGPRAGQSDRGPQPGVPQCRGDVEGCDRAGRGIPQRRSIWRGR